MAIHQTNKRYAQRDPFTLILVYKRLKHSHPKNTREEKREEKRFHLYKPSAPVRNIRGIFRNVSRINLT
jgi:hypothetical protein